MVVAKGAFRSSCPLGLGRWGQTYQRRLKKKGLLNEGGISLYFVAPCGLPERLDSLVVAVPKLVSRGHCGSDIRVTLPLREDQAMSAAVERSCPAQGDLETALLLGGMLFCGTAVWRVSGVRN